MEFMNGYVVIEGCREVINGYVVIEDCEKVPDGIYMSLKMWLQKGEGNFKVFMRL